MVSRNNGAWNGGYGNYVVITHGNGTQTLYAHMSHAIVSSGETVSAGQTIGYVGMTGLTTGPHVHFEIRGAAILSVDCRTVMRAGVILYFYSNPNSPRGRYWSASRTKAGVTDSAPARSAMVRATRIVR